MTFEVAGCLTASACCNGLTVLVEGKTVAQSWDITPHVISFLETLPKDHHHCAELAVATFYLVLADSNEGSAKKEGGTKFRSALHPPG